jgi:selenocysteine-specific elongation factor
MIVATSGHVDHGKTELIKALTGTNTDRLPEEKARGLTVDLGFAYNILPDGEVLGFVDVPGHEKFIRNMLAGVAGIDLGLLVIAADDGVMPQTREHLAILDLLGIRNILIVLTKIDRVAPDDLSEVSKQVDNFLREQGHRDHALYPVCAPKGIGIEALKEELMFRAKSRKPKWFSVTSEWPLIELLI